MHKEEILIRKSDGSDAVIFSDEVLVKTGIPSVDKLNLKVVKFMEDFVESKMPHLIKPEVITSEDINLIIFTSMRYRAFTILIGAQTSSRGRRFVAYISTKILHKGFTAVPKEGSLSKVPATNKEIIEEIKKKLKEMGQLEFINDVERMFGL